MGDARRAGAVATVAGHQKRASAPGVAAGAGAGVTGRGMGDAAGGFVFAGPRGGPITGLDAAMREVCKAIGAERATPHDLRRTHGTTITKLRFGRAAMNRIQNHKEGGIADVYDVHDYADENKHIMEAVAARIVGLVEGRPAAGGKVVPLY